MATTMVVRSIPTIESVICRSITAARVAEGKNVSQFYRTLVASLIVDGLLIPPGDSASAGYVKSAESRQTDLVECQIKQYLEDLYPEDREIALRQIVRTFFSEAAI